MCFYSAPWPSYYIAHSLQLPVVSKLIRNLNVMASHLKKKKRKRHRVQKKRVLRMPLSLGISYFGLGMQRMKIKSQILKVQANANS